MNPLENEISAALLALIKKNIEAGNDEALAADLRHVLRKHKARIVWCEELAGRVTISAVIEDAPEGLIRNLAGWFRRTFL